MHSESVQTFDAVCTAIYDKKDLEADPVPTKLEEFEYLPVSLDYSVQECPPEDTNTNLELKDRTTVVHNPSDVLSVESVS